MNTVTETTIFTLLLSQDDRARSVQLELMQPTLPELELAVL